MNKKEFKYLASILCFLIIVEPCFAVNFSKSDELKNKKVGTITMFTLLSMVGITALGTGLGLLYKYTKNQNSNTANPGIPSDNSRPTSPNLPQDSLSQDKNANLIDNPSDNSQPTSPNLPQDSLSQDKDANLIDNPSDNSQPTSPNLPQNALNQDNDKYVETIGNSLLDAIENVNKDLVESYISKLYNIKSANIIEWLYKSLDSAIKSSELANMFSEESDEGKISSILWEKFELWLKSKSLHIISECEHYPPLLEKAIEIGDDDIFNIVWKERINLKIPDEQIEKALIMAISKGNKEILKTILKEYPKLETPNEQISEILLITISEQNEKMLKAILEKFLELNISDEQVSKILENVDYCGKSEILKTIFEKYPNLKIQDNQINEALITIVQIGSKNKKIFDTIWADLKLRITNIQILESLERAANYSDKEIFETIFDWAKYKNLDILNGRIGQSILEDSIRYLTKKEIFNIILTEIKNISDLNTKNKYIDQCFKWAIEYNAHHINIFKPLLENGASINLQDKQGNTPLHIAVKNRCCRHTILFLLENGAEVNTKNYNGQTAMDLAEDLPNDTSDSHWKLEVINLLTTAKKTKKSY